MEFLAQHSLKGQLPCFLSGLGLGGGHIFPSYELSLPEEQWAQLGSCGDPWSAQLSSTLETACPRLSLHLNVVPASHLVLAASSDGQ